MEMIPFFRWLFWDSSDGSFSVTRFSQIVMTLVSAVIMLKQTFVGGIEDITTLLMFSVGGVAGLAGKRMFDKAEKSKSFRVRGQSEPKMASVADPLLR